MLNKYFTSLEGLLDQINSFQSYPEPTGTALFFEEPFQVYGLLIPKLSFELKTEVYLVSYAVAQLINKETICYWAYGNPLVKQDGKLIEIPSKNIIRILFHKGTHAAIAFHDAETISTTPFFSHIFKESDMSELPSDLLNVYLNSVQEQFRVNTEYAELFKERLLTINKDLPSFI